MLDRKESTSFLARKQQYYSSHSKKERLPTYVSSPRGADPRSERQNAPQRSIGRYAPLRDADFESQLPGKISCCINVQTMEVMEYGTPTRAPRSLYISPWKNEQFRPPHFERGRRRLRSPSSTMLSRSICKRYGRVVISLLLITMVIVAASQLSSLEAIPFGHQHEHEISEAIVIAKQPDMLASAYAAPLPKPTWENQPDEEGTPLSQPQISGEIDWSKQAYATYATDVEYLCNALMMFARLIELNTLASKVLIFPIYWQIEDNNGLGRMLRQARDEYEVVLNPVEVLTGEGQKATWAQSYTKLLVWNLTRYEKVLYMDNDGMVLQVSMEPALDAVYAYATAVS